MRQAAIFFAILLSGCFEGGVDDMNAEDDAGAFSEVESADRSQSVSNHREDSQRRGPPPVTESVKDRAKQVTNDYLKDLELRKIQIENEIILACKPRVCAFVDDEGERVLVYQSQDKSFWYTGETGDVVLKEYWPK